MLQMSLSFRRTFADMFRHMREMRGYFLWAAIVFFGGIAYGAVSDTFREFLEGQISALAKTAGRLSELENGRLLMFVFIFANNTIKSILVMFLGLFGGVIPLFFLLVNGMVIGYWLANVEGTGMSAAEIVVKGLLPHGVLEIPAIVVASAYGMGLGVQLVRSAIPKIRIPGQLERTLATTLPLMPFLTLVLLAAAVIEVTVTPWLLRL